MISRRISALAVALAALLASCTGGGATPSPSGGRSASPPPPSPATAQQLTVLTHDSFAVSDTVLAIFQTQNNVTVQVLRAGDAGAMVNQAILTADNPVADVLFGVDNTFLSRALDAGIFEPHRSSLAGSVAPALRLDARERATPIDYGDVCLNYDRAAFTEGAPAPATLEDLAKPEYGSKLVIENPATSSPGLAFMLATIVRFGESGDYTWLDYWRDLRDNDVLVSAGWEDAYYSSFSGGSGEGDRPIVVSYATSPAAEVYYAEPQPADAPTGVVTDGCFRQIEFAAVLVGGKHAQLAEAFIDFMLSPEFQADIPLNMFVFPAVPTTTLPPVFVDNAAQVAQPLTMAPDTIAANRERWLGEWTDAVLH
jgi:thiamine transport system substrate-binding protein